MVEVASGCSSDAMVSIQQGWRLSEVVWQSRYVVDWRLMERSIQDIRSSNWAYWSRQLERDLTSERDYVVFVAAGRSSSAITPTGASSIQGLTSVSQ